MATSGTSVFTVTRDQVIRQSMLNIGVLDGDEAPTAQEISDCSFILNMLVKQWQGTADYAPGLKTWKRRRGSLFLSTQSGSYTLGPGAIGWTEDYIETTVGLSASLGDGSIVVSSVSGVVATNKIGIQLASGNLQWTTIASIVGTTVNLTDTLITGVSAGAKVYVYSVTANQPLVIEAAVLRDSNGNDQPLRLLEQPEYDMLPSKVSVGNQGGPTAIYYEFQRENSNLFIDSAGVVDVTRHIVLTYIEAVQSVINPLDELEYPQEWFLPLCWGLSEQIAPMFHVDFTPQMEKAYKTSLSIAQRKEPEKSRMFFQVNE